jgi:hypothetical protein
MKLIRLVLLALATLAIAYPGAAPPPTCFPCFSSK